MSYLSEFHAMLGNETRSRYWAERSNATTQAIHSKLWDEEALFFSLHHYGTKNNLKMNVVVHDHFAYTIFAKYTVSSRVLHGNLYNVAFGTKWT